jgi:putative copper export protein
MGLFLVMVVIATTNRVRHVPRLVHEAGSAAAAVSLRRLRRNAVAEVAIGTIIIGIVAVLGITPPGLPEQISPHASHSH